MATDLPVPRIEGTELHLLNGVVAHLDERGQFTVPAHHMRVFVDYVAACEAAFAKVGIETRAG